MKDFPCTRITLQLSCLALCTKEIVWKKAGNLICLALGKGALRDFFIFMGQTGGDAEQSACCGGPA